MKTLQLKQETKVKLFKFINKILFCKLIKLHLPVPTEKGFTCVICSKPILLGK